MWNRTKGVYETSKNSRLAMYQDSAWKIRLFITILQLMTLNLHSRRCMNLILVPPTRILSMLRRHIISALMDNRFFRGPIAMPVVVIGRDCCECIHVIWHISRVNCWEFISFASSQAGSATGSESAALRCVVRLPGTRGAGTGADARCECHWADEGRPGWDTGNNDLGNGE